MISEDSELAAFNVVEKVFYCERDGQQFTIKSALLLLSIGEFPGKEGDRAPDTVDKPFKLATNCFVGGIHSDPSIDIQLGVLEEGGPRQSRLGSKES